jgi:hypothetical protein
MYTSKTASMDRSRVLSALALPHFAIAFGVSLSFIAWCCPPVSLAGKGYVSDNVTMAELGWTLGAYGFVTCASAAGYYLGIPIGRHLPKPRASDQLQLTSGRVWTVWIFLAALGVGSAGFKIVSAMGISGCIRTIATFNANAFKGELYTEYNIGLLSLRYIAILSAAVAIYRYLAHREVSVRSVVSMILLGIVALISSRLSLLWAVIIGVSCYAAVPPSTSAVRITRKEIVVGSLLLLGAVSALTISRTYMFYQEHGAESVFSAVGSEFQRYLAAPFHGSILAVNRPLYGAALSKLGGIDTGLTTNSALLELAILVGRWNVLGLGAIVFASSFGCGVIKQLSTTYLVVLFGVLQGCHFEIWRLLMFQRGITLTLLATIISVLAFYGVFRLPTLRVPQVRIRI